MDTVLGVQTDDYDYDDAVSIQRRVTRMKKDLEGSGHDLIERP
jgi:hypothetical protein